MKEERHSFSEPRPLISNNNNDDLPTWQVDVFRDGVSEPVATLVINNDTFPPRYRKTKVVWKLPENVEETPRFGTEDKRRLLDLFKQQKKEQRKGKVILLPTTTTTTSVTTTTTVTTKTAEQKNDSTDEHQESDNDDDKTQTAATFSNTAAVTKLETTAKAAIIATNTPARSIISNEKEEEEEKESGPTAVTASSPSLRLAIIPPPPGLAPPPPPPPPPGFAHHNPLPSPTTMSKHSNPFSHTMTTTTTTTTSLTFQQGKNITNTITSAAASPRLQQQQQQVRCTTLEPPGMNQITPSLIKTTHMANLDIASSSDSSSIATMPQHEQPQRSARMSPPPPPLPPVIQHPSPLEPRFFFRGSSLQAVLHQVEDMFYPQQHASSASSTVTPTTSLSPLYLYYTPQAQKSVSVGGVFVSCTNRAELCLQVLSLQQSMTLQNKTWITNRLVQTIDGSGSSGDISGNHHNANTNTQLLLLVLTGKTLPPPVAASAGPEKGATADLELAAAWPFSHSLLLVASPSTPSLTLNTMVVTEHDATSQQEFYQYQIQNDILCLFPNNS
jgi:hypothetical protein